MSNPAACESEVLEAASNRRSSLATTRMAATNHRMPTDHATPPICARTSVVRARPSDSPERDATPARFWPAGARRPFRLLGDQPLRACSPPKRTAAPRAHVSGLRALYPPPPMPGPPSSSVGEDEPARHVGCRDPPIAPPLAPLRAGAGDVPRSPVETPPPWRFGRGLPRLSSGARRSLADLARFSFLTTRQEARLTRCSTVVVQMGHALLRQPGWVESCHLPRVPGRIFVHRLTRNAHSALRHPGFPPRSPSLLDRIDHTLGAVDLSLDLQARGDGDWMTWAEYRQSRQPLPTPVGRRRPLTGFVPAGVLRQGDGQVRPV